MCWKNRDTLTNWIQATRQQLRQILSSKHDTGKVSATPTIFQDILTGNLPPEELTLKRLTEEATSVNGAGMETVTWTLSVACFHVLDQPATLARLKKELQEAMPNPQEILPSDQLEKLSYLSAVISEGESSPDVLHPTPEIQY